MAVVNELRPSSDRSSEATLGQKPKQDNPTRLKAFAGAEPTSSRGKLLCDFRSQQITCMTRFVTLQHTANNLRDTTVQTIFDELEAAKLSDKETRSSLVTSLNRLKNVHGYITWPDGKRGEEITLTPKGKTYLTELITKKLQPNAIRFLRDNASASISAHLSPEKPNLSAK
jgi:hypothetical protein